MTFSLFILQGGSSIMGILPMIIMFVIIYFFFIRPQAQKQKEQVTFQTNLSVGNTVVSSSGVIGKITKLDTNEVVIETEGKTHLRMLRSAISKEMTDALK